MHTLWYKRICQAPTLYTCKINGLQYPHRNTTVTQSFTKEMWLHTPDRVTTQKHRRYTNLPLCVSPGLLGLYRCCGHGDLLFFRECLRSALLKIYIFNHLVLGVSKLAECCTEKFVARLFAENKGVVGLLWLQLEQKLNHKSLFFDLCIYVFFCLVTWAVEQLFFHPSWLLLETM